MGGCITASHKESDISFHALDYSEINDVDIRNLPRDLWVDVFSKLDVITQQRVRRVCALWNHLISRPPLSLRHSVRFELNPRTYTTPRNPHPTDGVLGLKWHPRRENRCRRLLRDISTSDAIDRIFTACLRPETKEIIFSHPPEDRHTPCVRRSLLLRALFDPPNDIGIIRKTRPVAKQRVIFANLALTVPPIAGYYGYYPVFEISLPEVILRNVTLVAEVSIRPSQTFTMKVTGVNRRCDTSEEVDRLMYYRKVTYDDGIKWAQFSSELAGPLNARDEQLAVDWLSQPCVHRILKDALSKTDVLKSMDRSFQRDLVHGGRDGKDCDQNWFHGLDLWTQRFLYHYLNDNVMCSV